MKKGLLILSFIEGSAVMCAELCGAKLMAPVFGSSLFVWSAVMGITLCALALGYFYGGRISGRSKAESFLQRILVIASFFLVAMPILSDHVIPVISLLPFLSSVILSTLLLLFMPVFLLGASSPLFIVLQTEEGKYAGKVSGTVYAVSTLGGIMATFLCGFVMIPHLGLTFTLSIFGFVLFVSTLIAFRVMKIAAGIFMIGFVVVSARSALAGNGVIFSSQGVLGFVEVEDLKRETGAARLLKVNRIVQSEMDMVSKKSLSKYISLLDSLIVPAIRGKALVLGVGAGLTSNLLNEKNYRVTGVEIDERIMEVAKKYFFMKNRDVVIDDARKFINTCRESYDLVLADLYKAEEAPDHVFTMESMAKLKMCLNPDAVLFIGWHGYVSGKEGEGTSVLYQTIASSGFHVKMFTWTNDENQRNIIFAAALKKESLPCAKTSIDPRTLMQVNSLNTDDRPLLEKYNAYANKRWRSIYLRYYNSGRDQR